MRHFSLFLLLLFLNLNSCATKREVIVNGKAYRLPPPPGMAQIDENRFMDVTEITNSDYLFYTYWYFFLQGSGHENEWYDYVDDPNCYSLELKRLPMKDESRIYEYCLEKYWSHPYVQDAALIGVDFNNAQGYTKWRQDRIAENILIEADLIDEKEVQGKHFTLDGFLRGKVKLNPTKLKWIALPVLSLPEVEDVELAVRDVKEEYFVRRRKTSFIYGYKLSSPPLFLDDCVDIITFEYSSNFERNNYGVFYLKDGVDEFVWPEDKTDLEKGKVLKYGEGEFYTSQVTADIKTGFRCVGEYIIVELPVKPGK